MEPYTQNIGSINTSEMPTSGLPLFKKHKKEWFLNRVGEVVNREFTVLTPSSVKANELTKSIQICSEKHAVACYVYHLDNKINFTETQIKTK